MPTSVIRSATSSRASPGPRSSHLHRGLFEAHARDEAGFEDERGHKQMWFVGARRRVRGPGHRGRDGADARTHGHRPAAGARRPTRRGSAVRWRRPASSPTCDLDFEMLIERMINLLLDRDLGLPHVRVGRGPCSPTATWSPGEGEAARLCPTSARTRHLTSSTCRPRSPRCATARSSASRDASTRAPRSIGRFWERGLAESLGPGRDAEPHADPARGRARARRSPEAVARCSRSSTSTAAPTDRRRSVRRRQHLLRIA